MPDGNSIINLGHLSKPADTLIKKISEAIEGTCKPWQIKRIAKAESEAEQIKALSKVKTATLEQRALRRFMLEETKRQCNIENITAKSISRLNATAKPEKIENDWITNFFDKCRLVSDQQMQDIWSKILAGEANSPGRFSKRTVNFMESLDKQDAQLFTKLCAFNWIIGNIQPIIYDSNEEIYKKNGITFSTLKHLDAIGLISFENLTGYRRQGLQRKIIAIYKNIPFILTFPKENHNEISIGKVLLTSIGEELADICTPETIDGFDNYIIKKWKESGIEVTK